MSKPKIDISCSEDGIEMLTLTLDILKSYHSRMELSRLSPWQDPTEEKKARYTEQRREVGLDLLEFVSSGDRIKHIPECYHEAYKDYVADIFKMM